MKFVRKLLKWIGILLLAALGLGLLALISLYYLTNQKINRVYDIQVEPIQVPVDPQIIERGRHIVLTRGQCIECHGPDFSGQVFDEGAMTVRLAVSNLTSGNGGIGAMYTDEDWVRALRHGVKPNGKSVLGMPSEYFYNLSDADVAAIIAFVRSLPPVDKVHPKTTLGPMGRFFVFQMPFILPAQVIDHDSPRPPDPEPGVTVEYGQYLAHSCVICHGEDFAGGGPAGGGVNLTPGGDMLDWTKEDFFKAMRTGITPENEQLDKELMPWESLGLMTDDELEAIWVFLQTLPPIVITPTPTK